MLKQPTSGRYQMLKKLGGGGMASVYLAHDRRLLRKVAIKFLPEDSSNHKMDLAFLFHREARSIAALRHESIVQIYDYTGPEESPAYMVMEYVSGIDLEQLHEIKPHIPAPTVLSFLSCLASALAHCHDRGVIHRDLKPANIMLDPSSGRIVLMDFGLAKAFADQAASASTNIHTKSELIGTPEFLSPEQILEKTVGPQGDVFAFGCLAYTLFTGTSPFQDTNPVEIMRRIIDLQYLPLTDLDPSLPAMASELIDRCLTQSPQNRANMGEVIEFIGKMLASEKIYNAVGHIQHWLENTRIQLVTS